VQTGITTSSITISGSNIIIDELRLYPKNSLMTTFTYDPFIGMTSQTDSKNYTIYYVYDGSRRLSTIKDEDGNILETFQYNYSTDN
jgi:uncharacterized protein RhaS with RHS repeats